MTNQRLLSVFTSPEATSAKPTLLTFDAFIEHKRELSWYDVSKRAINHVGVRAANVEHTLR